MGCGCSKDTSTPDFRGSPALKPLPARSSSSRHSSARFSNVSAKLAAEKEKEKEKEREKERRRRNGGGMVGDGRWESEITGPIPKQSQGEQVAAGWPAWLSAVAGEAIKGWTPRRADSFQKLHKIGQGTYSNVYKARSLDSGRIVALKKVRFDNLDPESVRFMAREILILRRLDHPNVIKLEGLVTSRMSCSLYLVFEYMVHDLAGLAACPGITFTEPQVKCYMKQLFSGLEHSHSRGVLHRDIKGSNLLLDNSGVLKIADFGLATFYHPHQKQPLTSRVVTLWYRPPELLLGATEYGVGVDIWSTACILAELLAGKPIMPGRTEVEQLHKIFKLCGSPSEDYWKRSKLPHATIFKPQQPYKRCIAETFKDFPNSALSLLEKLLAIEPSERGDASSALKSEFFTTEPYACDPSSLPKYPPSKEMDAKMRDEAARRQRAAGAPRSRDSASKAVPAPQANAELQANLQRRRLSAQSGVKSKSEKFPEDSAIGFLMEPRRPHQPLPVVESKAISPSLRSLPPTSLSFRLDSMGNTVARKKGNGDDVCRAPSRPPAHSSAKSLSVSDFSAHSGDLSNLLSQTGSKSHIGSRGHVSVRLEGGTNRYGETESKRRDPDSKESHSRRSKRSGLSHEDISSID